MILKEVPVGCSENGIILWVYVAVESKEAAEEFIKTYRPRLTIMCVGEPTQEVEVEKPQVMRLQPCY